MIERGLGTQYRVALVEGLELRLDAGLLDMSADAVARIADLRVEPLAQRRPLKIVGALSSASWRRSLSMPVESRTCAVVLLDFTTP